MQSSGSSAAGSARGNMRALVIAGAAVLALAQAGCAASSEPESAAALRARFSEQASRVLDEGEEIVASESGFTVAQAETSSGTNRAVERRGGLSLVLPRSAADAIRVSLPNGFEATVHEEGASGEGAIAGHAVAYPRENGTAFWNAVSNGYEEWLHVAPGLAKRDRTIAAWTVEGAAVEKRAGVVVLLDEDGVPRVTVTAPAAYAADGKQVEAKLAVREQRIELSVDAGGQEVLVDPLWSPTGAMGIGQRVAHTETLLQDGKVLVLGGDDWEVTASFDYPVLGTEIYDPATNIWSVAAPLPEWREFHTATLLGDGKVLVAGGGFNGPSVDLYDPATNTWSAAAPLAEDRSGHTATLLGDGRVLVVGGYTSSVEIYDPATGTWSAVSPLAEARGGHTAILLQNGKVLVVGGADDATLSVELYDPATNTWSTGASPTDYKSGTATLLADGRVLTVADYSGTSELYDPATDTWSAAAPLAEPRYGFTATLLQSGKVLVAGGFSSWVSEVYDPTTNTWSVTAYLTKPRVFHTATRLQNGWVLAAGGAAFTYGEANGELYVYAPGCVDIARGSGSVADSYIRSQTPAQNFGGATELSIGPSSQALLQFDLSGVPLGVTFTKATLRLRTSQATGAPTVNLHAILDPWSEQTVTYSSFGGAVASALVGSYQATKGLHKVDVLSQVQAWRAVPGSNHGLLLESSGKSAIFSSEAAMTDRPVLRVCYTAD